MSNLITQNLDVPGGIKRGQLAAMSSSRQSGKSSMNQALVRNIFDVWANRGKDFAAEINDLDDRDREIVMATINYNDPIEFVAGMIFATDFDKLKLTINYDQVDEIERIRAQATVRGADEMARILARILDVRDVVHMPAFVFDSLLSPGPNPSKTQMITLATKRKGEGTDFHFDPTLRLRDIE